MKIINKKGLLARLIVISVFILSFSCKSSSDSKELDNTELEGSSINKPEGSGINKPEGSGINEPEGSGINKPEDLGEDIPEEAVGGSETNEKEARNKYLAEDLKDNEELKSTEKILEPSLEEIETFPDE